MTKEKIAAIQKQLRSGLPEGEIKEELRKEGYTEEEIKQAFPPHKADMRSWYFISGIILTIAGAWRFFVDESLLLLFFGIIMFTLYYAEHRRQLQKNE